MLNKNIFILLLLLFVLPVFGEDFWNGVEQFRNGHYLEAASILESVLDAWQDDSSAIGSNSATASPNSIPSSYLPLAANLYSLSLIKGGRLEEGYKEFSSFYQQGVLDAQGQFNYAVAALQKKDFATAYTVCSGAATEDSVPDAGLEFNYVAALASLGLENWAAAEDFFKRSRTRKSPEKDFFLQHYLGLSQFRQGKLEAAFATLEPLGHLSASPVNFNSSLEIQEAGYQSMELALHCALQLYHQTKDKDWWSASLALVHQLMDSSPDEKSRQKAVLQAAYIYRDGGETQRAVELLRPYSKGQDVLSLSCRMLQAELVASLGQLEEGIEEYKKIAELCSPSSLGKTSREILSMGDKASYSRGELLYSAEKYGEATRAFSEYRRDYPSGKYQDAALYFKGEALAKTGFIHEAILQHETLVKQYPDSPYVFGSLLELMDLYRETQDYDLALQQGNQLQAFFFQQAQGAGVSEKMAELRLLEQGLQSKEASVLAEYRRVGEYKTAAGRRVGVELALFYGPSSGKETQGEKLLLQILDNCSGGEEAVAAQASAMLGDLYRNQNKYKEAAKEFLRSAELYLKTDRSFDEDAATALYRGAESFDVAGMKSDAKAVAQKLLQLFPESRWAQAGKIFL